MKMPESLDNVDDRDRLESYRDAAEQPESLDKLLAIGVRGVREGEVVE